MRDKNGLKDIEDVSILLKYLYMNEENKIIINNGITNLEISMTDDYDIMAKNLKFPDIPEMCINSDATIDGLLNMIDALKEKESSISGFNNYWDEIKITTEATLALNK